MNTCELHPSWSLVPDSNSKYFYKLNRNVDLLHFSHRAQPNINKNEGPGKTFDFFYNFKTTSC